MRDPFHDTLTGLANHALFLDRFDHALAQARRSGRKVALLLLAPTEPEAAQDFKEDQARSCARKILELGLTRTIAGELKGRTRQADTLARLDTGHFALLIEQVHDYSQIEKVAAKLWPMFSRLTPENEDASRLCPSIRIAVFPEHGEHSAALIQSAQSALERTLNAGGNAYAFSDQAQRTRCCDPSLAGELRHAVEQQQLHLHYHPLIELITGRLAGWEALVRWQHPRLGWLEPADFLPQAEETTSIIAIGEWVLQEACMQAMHWQSRGGPAVPVAVNLSSAQMLHPGLEKTVLAALARCGLPAERLELEISEQSCLQENETLAVMKRLRSVGVRFSLDDFGAGQCPLGSLAKLPVNRLKMHRSLIKDMEASHASVAVVAALIDFAGSLGMEILAEGIETPHQLQILQEKGCRLGQGYLFGRPAKVRLETECEFFFPLSFGEPAPMER